MFRLVQVKWDKTVIRTEHESLEAIMVIISTTRAKKENKTIQIFYPNE